jgi:hypothetical protein
MRPTSLVFLWKRSSWRLLHAVVVVLQTATRRPLGDGFEIGPPSGSELDRNIRDLHADLRRGSLEQRGANGHEVNEGAPVVFEPLTWTVLD